MKPSRGERGQAVVFTVLCMTVVLGFVSLAVDVGLLFRAKRLMQTAADSGAIAGALELNYGDVTTAAQAAAALNGITSGSSGATVTVNNPPKQGAFTGRSGYVEVVVSQAQPTVFMRLFNRSSMAVSARSVATLDPSQFCVYVLGGSTPTGIQSVPGWNCGLIDNGSIPAGLSGTSVNIAGFSDPLGYLSEPSTAGCAAALTYSGLTATLTPGCYNGLTANNGSNITFASGLYIFTGAVKLGVNLGPGAASTFQGTGVTIYFNNTISFDSTSTFNLSAPTSGSYNGILLFEGRSDPSPVALTGASSSILQGIIYMPDATLDLSNASPITLDTSLVVGQITNPKVTLVSYATINPSTPLVQSKLVE